MALSDTFGALRERQFRLLWLGQATSTIGDEPLPSGPIPDPAVVAGKPEP